MRFKYKAAGPQGKIIEDEIEAQNTSEVLEFLVRRNLKPLTLTSVKMVVEKKGIFTPQITLSDKIFLTRYLGLMLKSGTDLFRAVNILITDYEKPALKMFLEEVRLNLQKGQPFYTSFLKHPRFFNPVFVNLVKAGESSGNLEEIFSRLSLFLEREQEFKNKIKSALTYPIFLLGLSFIILIFLSFFALPRIASIFEGAVFEPPAFSRLVFSFGAFLTQNILFIFSFLVISIIAFIYFYINSIIFRRFLFNLVNRISAIKSLIEKIAISRFASTLSSLIKSGLPLTGSIEITADAVGNEELKSALIRISQQGLQKGLTVGEAFSKEPFFPKAVVSLISIAEKTGHIEDTLSVLAGFYEKEVDNSLKNLITVLEPALLLGMGLIIGFVAIAIIVPIYQMVGAF